MNAFLNGTTKIARRVAAPGLAAAVAALSVAAYAGHAAAGHDANRNRGCNRNCRPTFTLAAQPHNAVVTAGSQARFRIIVRRRHLRGTVTLRIFSGLPVGAAARFSAWRIRGRRSILVIRTSNRIRPARYRLRLIARAGGVSRKLILTLTILRASSASAGGGLSAGATGSGSASGSGSATGSGSAGGSGSATAGQTAPFTIAGDAAAPLEPGIEQPIDLRLANPNPVPVTVTALTMGVQSVSAPAATAALPCTANDFAVTQFSGSLPLSIPASSTKTLADLGIPTSQWPQIALLDLPTDQDGCQGASVTLAYGGSARLG